jgi:hypothetical protein
MTRAKLVKLTATVEYSDGSQKIVEFDTEKGEGLFWSDRAVLEVLAPFYESYSTFQSQDLDELSEYLGRDIDRVTPEIVNELWTRVGDKVTGDQPAMLLKTKQCIPTNSCKRCLPD